MASNGRHACPKRMAILIDHENICLDKIEAIIIKMKILPRSNLNVKAYYNALPSPETRIIVFDTETTGLNPDKDEIVEIGAIELINFQRTRTFHQFARPT